MSDATPQMDFSIVSRDLKIQANQIEQAVQLLDDGNTISFITRFRKDQTGGLNELQIQAIKQRVEKLRAIGERKAFVIKTIESQGKLTDELKANIEQNQVVNYLDITGMSDRGRLVDFY